MKGIILAAQDERIGALLVGGVSSGVTSIVVDDPEAFDEDGGQIQWGKSGTIDTYTAVNDTTSVMTTLALIAAHADRDEVWAYPVASVRYALVQIEGDEGEAMQAVIPKHLERRLPTGTYDEPVACDVGFRDDGLELLIRHIVGRGGVNPPHPTGVTIEATSIDRVAGEWESPDDPIDSDFLNQDIVEFQAQLSTSATFSPVTGFSSVYKFERAVRTTKKTWKVPAGAYYLAIRTVRPADGRKSLWVPARLTPNSDPNAAPEAGSGVTIVATASGRILVTWTIPGAVQEKHYDQLFTAPEPYKFIKARARVGRHDVESHPTMDGTPGGGPIKSNLRLHGSGVPGGINEEIHIPVMKNEDRLIIVSDTHKDVVWSADMNVKTMREDEALSLRVAQVGTTRAGSNLIVTMVLEPYSDTGVVLASGLTARGRGRAKIVTYVHPHRFSARAMGRGYSRIVAQHIRSFQAEGRGRTRSKLITSVPLKTFTAHGKSRVRSKIITSIV